MNDSKTIELLNKLIQINNDRFERMIALETYQNRLGNDLDNLSFGQQKIINAKIALVRADYEKIKLLHEDLITSS